MRKTSVFALKHCRVNAASVCVPVLLMYMHTCIGIMCVKYIFFHLEQVADNEQEVSSSDGK